MKIFFVIFIILSYCHISYADTIIRADNKFRPSLSLYEASASRAAYSGMGAASIGDYSSADINPAITAALKKQYLVFADTNWQQKQHMVNIGILDNNSTPLATLLQVRESIPNNQDSRDRRFSLALAYLLPNTNFSLGLSLNYEQMLLQHWNSFQKSNFFADIGFLYEYITDADQPFFFGAGINRILDSYGNIEYNTGISTTFLQGFYSIGIESLESNLSGLEKVATALNILANQFLDLRWSYGWNIKKQKQIWGAGIFFHAPVIQLFYTFASPEDNNYDNGATLQQSAGCALNFTL